MTTRAEMVHTQLRQRGISDERVLTAMGEVPREAFVGAELRDRAYDDCALPLAHGQTISQPWIVAAICEALELRGSETVLEVGTGSGYSATVLSRLARRVISVELSPELAATAKYRLRALRAANVEVVAGDGGAGMLERAPFEGIAVHAATPRVPTALIRQLAPRGRLVAPIAERDGDVLTVFTRLAEDGPDGEPALEPRPIAPCRFVPLLGEFGFEGESR